MKKAYPVLLMFIGAWLCLAIMTAASHASAADGSTGSLKLPKPDTSGGKPLMEALSLRKTTRSFSDKAVSEQELSNLLWAAWGVNRSDMRRTVPTSMNKKNVALYAVMQNGVWLYDAEKHELSLALAGDMRSKYGGAPLTLVYAAEDGYYASGMHVGSMYQNAGLYCASVGLGNVVKRSGVDALDGALNLPNKYRVFIVQSIGWPKD